MAIDDDITAFPYPSGTEKVGGLVGRDGPVAVVVDSRLDIDIDPPFDKDVGRIIGGCFYFWRLGDISLDGRAIEAERA